MMKNRNVRLLLCAALCALLLCFAVVATSAAALPDPDFTMETELSEDKTVLTVVISAKAYATVLDSQSAYFSYDSDSLELTSYELVGDFASETVARNEPGLLTISSFSSLTADGELLRATFKVKDACEVPAIGFRNILLSFDLESRATVELASEAIDMHAWKKGEVTPPTCTEEGYTTYTCDKCEDTKKEDFQTALGHDETGAPASCLVGKICAREDCEFELEPATGHEMGPAATCTEPQICLNGCGHEFAEKLGHAEGAAATCTTDQVCTREECGIVLNERLGHAPGAAATCTTDQVCTRENCGIVLNAREGHVPGAAATCTTDQVCTRESCGAVLKERLGHQKVHFAAYPVTCTQDGWQAYEKCERCEYNSYQLIPARGHDVIDGVCTVCGATFKTGMGTGGVILLTLGIILLLGGAGVGVWFVLKKKNII